MYFGSQLESYGVCSVKVGQIIGFVCCYIVVSVLDGKAAECVYICLCVYIGLLIQSILLWVYLYSRRQAVNTTISFF